MNKEELIRTLKYTEKKHRNDTVNTFDTDISMMCVDVLKVLKNCIEIPEEATKGEVFMLMFPDVEVEIEGKYITLWVDEYKWIDIDYELWNAPYKEGAEE